MCATAMAYRTFVSSYEFGWWQHSVLVRQSVMCHFKIQVDWDVTIHFKGSHCLQNVAHRPTDDTVSHPVWLSSSTTLLLRTSNLTCYLTVYDYGYSEQLGQNLRHSTAKKRYAGYGGSEPFRWLSVKKGHNKMKSPKVDQQHIQKLSPWTWRKCGYRKFILRSS